LEFQSLGKNILKKSYKKQLPFGHKGVDRYPPSTGIHGELFNELFDCSKTPFKLCLLCFSLWGIAEKIICEIFG
jgi:hypothetical protein